MKCQCKWIDRYGVPTPDDNDAIAMAVCYSPGFGPEGSIPFPICKSHASQRPPFWKFFPLPKQEVGETDEK